jgi:hypothetical protein
MYLDEQREFEKQNMDAAKMNELKHLLDESDEA